MKSMKLPETVQYSVEKYLSLVDRKLPDTVVAFYLVGSVALGDYQDGLSDIDFVAVCDNPLSSDELATAEELHRELADEVVEPDFDGVYVVRDRLRKAPDGTGIASCRGGVLGREQAFNVNPVTWHLLKSCPVSLRGNPKPEVFSDDAALREWCRGNIRGYWQSWTKSSMRKLMNPIETDDIDTVWGVLGVTRLHATIASGEVISKSGAADYAKQTFEPQWHKLVDEIALARRNNRVQGIKFSMKQKRTALRYMEHVITDALS
jgi:predicted nucleotidyltransferase